MRLISLTKWPPGGWQYVNPVTGWRSPGPHDFGLELHVQNVIKHRKANKLGQPTDPMVVKQEIIDFTCERLMKDIPQSQWKLWIMPDNSIGQPTESVKKNYTQYKQPILNQAANAVAKLAVRLAGLPQGAATIAEWVGDGMVPVETDLANERSKTCTTCPLNVDSSFFDLFTGPIAESIRRTSEVKNMLELKTKNDHRLGVCDACGCHLKTKVWVPVHTIRKHKSDFTKKLPRHCWIETEP